jgi:hypothetical protein
MARVHPFGRASPAYSSRRERARNERIQLAAKAILNADACLVVLGRGLASQGCAHPTELHAAAVPHSAAARAAWTDCLREHAGQPIPPFLETVLRWQRDFFGMEEGEVCLSIVQSK